MSTIADLSEVEVDAISGGLLEFPTIPRKYQDENDPENDSPVDPYTGL